MQIVSELTTPPEVGKFYLVPAILMSRFALAPEVWWPVHGSRHQDAEFFQFPHEHYHVDPRFLSRQHLHQIGDFMDRRGHGALERSYAQPVSPQFAAFPELKKPLPPPTLRRMRCKRLMPDYPYAGQDAIHRINAAFAGRVCKRGRLGLVCPHQQYPLGQQVPDADGIVTCPLHGLRIRAEDGVCVGSTQSEKT